VSSRAGPSDLARGVLSGDRRSLARAITLVESRRADDEQRALALLRSLLPRHRRGMRVGFSGPPGVGKSTLLERLGMLLVREGRRPALLVVDPSSQRGGGSILGDKTRMPELSREPAAYVRPSPSGEGGGGIAATTGDVLIVCEAAGFGPCLVETVGVGQAETAVTSVVDLLCVLLEPGQGDGLQGIKRGLHEWGDVLAVNKADGSRAEMAESTRLEYQAAIGLLRGADQPPVLCVSARESRGIAELWLALEDRHRALEARGELEERRREQRKAELGRRLTGGLLRRFLSDAGRAGQLAELEERVASGELLPGEAVRELLS
jgi:LAO/AO transport system kinase